MEIQRVTDIKEFLKCLPVEMEILKKSRRNIRLRDLVLFITYNIENPDFMFWIAYNEKKEIRGYCVAFFANTILEKVIYLLRMYCDPKEKGLSDEFAKTIEDWMKEKRATTIRIEAEQHIKALQKKWKFKPMAVIMERRI